MVESDEFYRYKEEREEEKRIQEEIRREKEAEMRNTTYYRRIRAYLLEHYDKGDIVFYDWQGRYQIFETVCEKYSINESLPETSYHRICKLAMNDLVEKGIYSKLGDQYVSVTENTTKLEKEEPKAKKKTDNRNKIFRQQQKAAKIKARKEAKKNIHNQNEITEGFEH